MTAQKDHVALVTGGAQGIGKGIAKHFLEIGMKVVIADCDIEAGEETATEYSGLGAIRFVPTNVIDETAVKTAVEKTIDFFGQLNALVNNAGIANAHNVQVEKLSLDDWNRVIAANLTGYFLFAKHAVPYLRKMRGTIINIASTRALQSEPHTEAYSASKGGIVALTHALAISLGPDIRVNCISPGWIEVGNWKKQAAWREPQHSLADQQQHPVGRVGEPSDIAAMAAFLISAAAGFMTGQNFVIDGGMTKKMIYVE
jgi:NAD(P)-dependent dehydrogenase (short-subunit alcohol dehydrogenase family)